MKTKTLQYQFNLWTVLLIIIPSLLVMLIYTVGQITSSKKNNLELISQRVHSQERLIQYWLNERANTVREISQLEAFKTLNEEEMIQTLTVMQQGNKTFDSLAYIDKDGIFKIFTIQSPSLLGQRYAGGPLVKVDFISNVFLGHSTGTPLINFTSPIYDYNGNFQGVVLGSIKTKMLTTLLHDNWIGETGEVLLVNRDGILLTEPRDVSILAQKGLIETTAIMKLKISDDALRNIKLGETGTATWMDYNDEEVLSAYQDMPERNWTLIGKINKKEVFTPIYKQLFLMSIAILFILFLMVPLSTAITNRIKRPLDWLIVQSNLVATKNYDPFFTKYHPATDMPHELRLLCDTFIKMSVKIQKTVSLLRENEAKLENKVHERTMDLSAINTKLKAEITEHQTTNAFLKISQVAFSVSEIRYKNLFHHMHAGFSYYKVVFDLSNTPIDLEYINVNPAYEKFMKKTATELIGKRRTEIDPHILDEKFNWLKTYTDVALSRNPTTFTEYFHQHQRWYSISAYSPMEGHVAVISEDITHYIAIKAEVARMDRLNLIGNMSAGLAHEIRNPLTVIKGYLQFFKKKLPNNLHDQLSLVLNELARIETIITDFLSIAKNKPTELEPQDLNMIINSIAPFLLTNAVKRGMHLEFKLCEKLPKYLLAVKEIKQLILNLALNGLDAMQKHGTLIIETKYDNNNLILCITDSGSGIPLDLQQKIFDPFFTTRDEGTGLGLSVCASIVERHHGIIKITSQENVGTCFTITFQDK